MLSNVLSLGNLLKLVCLLFLGFVPLGGGGGGKLVFSLEFADGAGTPGSVEEVLMILKSFIAVESFSADLLTFSTEF